MKTIPVKCEHCAVIVVNNVICHEIGCPSESHYIGDEETDRNPEIENWYPEDDE